MAKPTSLELIKNPKRILIKKPFSRGGVPFVHQHLVGTHIKNEEAQLPQSNKVSISQDRFLEELDTYSHAIMSRDVFNDRPVSFRDSSGAEHLRYIPVTRISLPLQRIIKTKQKAHLTGNDLLVELANENPTEEDQSFFIQWKQFFTSKNMNVALSENVDNQLSTGDTALVMYFDKEGKIDWKSYSWSDGYCLLPHYDEYGYLVTMGIYYSSSEWNETKSAEEEVEMLDVWTERHQIRYRKDGQDWKAYAVTLHGFKECPVCYKRGDVAWNDVQNLIEKLEFHSSLWAEDLRFFGNPILFLKGMTDLLPGADMGGKAIAGEGDDSDAKLLQADESKNITNFMDFLLREIFRGSCTISFSPETVKTSGDLPGITVKLLFSAAVEKAMEQAKEWDDFIDRMIRLFTYGIGIESGNLAQFERLKIFGKIDPYIPQNTTEIINNLNSSVGENKISGKTYREVHPYSKADEDNRIEKEIEKTPEGGIPNSKNPLGGGSL